MLTIVCIIIAYLLGSISSAIIICKLTDQPDPRTKGSASAGATNVLRIAGKKLAVFTLLGDLLKGFIAVMIAKVLGLNGWHLGLIAIAVFLGHLYPIFFKFKGGKGIATGIGIMLALSLQLGGMVILTWIAIAIIFRYSSLASLVAFVLAPLYAWLLTEPIYAVAIAVITILIIWTHRTNLQRLFSGTEPKIGRK
jgi:glycerol-3-phosphate acyltransferase PlsY